MAENGKDLNTSILIRKRNEGARSEAPMCAYWAGGTSTYELACALAQTASRTTNSTEATELTHGSTAAARANGVSELCGGAGVL